MNDYSHKLWLRIRKKFPPYVNGHMAAGMSVHSMHGWGTGKSWECIRATGTEIADTC